MMTLIRETVRAFDREFGERAALREGCAAVATSAAFAALLILSLIAGGQA